MDLGMQKFPSSYFSSPEKRAGAGTIPLATITQDKE